MKKFLKITLIIFTIFLGIISGAFYVYYRNITAKIQMSSTSPYHFQGDDFIERKPEALVHFSEVPDYLVKATLIAEDKRFYQHPAGAWGSCIKPIFNHLLDRKSRQDSANLIYIVGSHHYRDLPEVFKQGSERFIDHCLFVEYFDSHYSRNEILEIFFNEAPYGFGKKGVQMVSQILFSKDVSNLTLAESVILAAQPRNPTRYNPLLDKKDEQGALLWKGRAKEILREMLENEFITIDKLENAISELDKISFNSF